MQNWLHFEYSNKQVTAHGGMSLVKRFLDRTAIKEKIASYGLLAPGSNAGYPVVEMFESFWISIWLGANRFSHTSVLQHDKVLQKIFGLRRATSNDTYRRFFQKFDLETSSNFFKQMYGWMFAQLKFDHFTLDVDSSVWTRYGKQEGAKKLDISEEKVRLANHLEYFIDTMEKEENPGRKLGFISQEIGREINTIGSKANDAIVQKLVVEMKDYLEKMKEQSLNVL